MSEKSLSLKDATIDLNGSFKSTIENNVFLCNGVDKTINDENNEPIAKMYVVTIVDMRPYVMTQGVLVVFNQVKDKLIFLYKKDKYEVISITNDLITLSKDGKPYSIERVNIPF